MGKNTFFTHLAEYLTEYTHTEDTSPITLAGCGSPVDTPALQRAICISFIYLQVASTVYLITNVFFFIFILFTVMLKLILKRANFALIPGNV